MQVYQHPTENRSFYAPDVEPTIELGLPVLSVDGLSTYNLPHPMLKRAGTNDRVHSDETGSGPGGQFLGSDMRTAYAGSTTLNGSGQAIGLIELGPYRLSDVLAYFASLNQQLNVPIVNVLLNVNGICFGSPPSGCDDGEEVTDIQQAIAMAPQRFRLTRLRSLWFWERCPHCLHAGRYRKRGQTTEHFFWLGWHSRIRARL
jgi:subtilase family serine protease